MNEQEIEYQISEYNTRKNRLKRYRRRLLKEALNVAKERGLELVVTWDSTIKSGKGQVVVLRDGEDTEETDLIELSKDRLPSLYGRFIQEYIKLGALHLRLQNIYDSIR